MANKTPAQVVTEMFGVRPLARTLRLTPGAVAHWHDTGSVPKRHYDALKAMARKHRKRLTTDMLVYGSGA